MLAPQVGLFKYSCDKLQWPTESAAELLQQKPSNPVRPAVYNKSFSSLSCGKTSHFIHSETLMCCVKPVWGVFMTKWLLMYRRTRPSCRRQMVILTPLSAAVTLVSDKMSRNRFCLQWYVCLRQHEEKTSWTRWDRLTVRRVTWYILIFR